MRLLCNRSCHCTCAVLTGTPTTRQLYSSQPAAPTSLYNLEYIATKHLEKSIPSSSELQPPTQKALSLCTLPRPYLHHQPLNQQLRSIKCAWQRILYCIDPVRMPPLAPCAHMRTATRPPMWPSPAAARSNSLESSAASCCVHNV